MTDHLILLMITGLAAGVFSGMFGIGGGVVIVPVLILMLGFTTVQAVSTSLAALLLPVGAFAVFSYYSAGKLDIRGAVMIAIGQLITTLLGAEIALALPGELLKQLYGIFLLYMGWRFAEPRTIWQSMRQPAHVTGTPPALEAADDAVRLPPYLSKDMALFIIGLVSGISSGMFGIGGGAIIVPALVGFLRYDQKLAVGTSLATMLLPVRLPGVIRFYEAGQLDISVAVMMALGLTVGALLGARLALRLPSKTVRQMYGIFLIIIGVWFIVEPFVMG